MSGHPPTRPRFVTGRPAPIVASDIDLAQAAQRALADRLSAVAAHLVPQHPPPPGDDPATDAVESLTALVRSLILRPDNDRIWLLLTAVAAAYPTRGDVDRTRRKLQLSGERRAVLAVLGDTLSLAAEAGEPAASVDVVTRSVVVDVDHSAKYDLHTGIQRVSRSLMPRWIESDQVLPAAWTSHTGILRRLHPSELARVVDWEGGRVEPDPIDAAFAGESRATRLVIPWRSVVVLVEVPPVAACDRIAAIGNYSGNRLVGIAYDAIPVSSADMVPAPDTVRFIKYLTAVKFARRMAAISASAAAEFSGFSEALATQGLPGPDIIEVALGAPSSRGRAAGEPGDPTQHSILVVGSHEPRKNHLAVLHSAEILWREGHRFTLSFYGGSGWGTEFPDRVRALVRCGRSIVIRRAVSDQELEAAYRNARFSVFPSLHEGYGLPVVESLAHGTPVITTDFGSTAQVAAGGGALLVDPRNDADLTAAMRTLLTDDAILADLREQIVARPERTWADYAEELWKRLVEPELLAVEDHDRDAAAVVTS